MPVPHHPQLTLSNRIPPVNIDISENNFNYTMPNALYSWILFLSLVVL